MTFPPPEEVAFVGGDPDSNANECPAVWRAPGGVFMRGKTVDDGELAARFGRDVGKGEDETDIWLPDSLFEAIREAVTDTFEDDRQGPGQHDFASLLKATRRSLIRFEMRDSYDETEPGFDEWRKTGDVSTYDWGDHLDQVRESTARGVRWRRVRVVSEPASEYIQWEHACTHTNVEAGEDIRWLPRTLAADLMLPGADCWVFDHRVIRWNFQRGNGTNPRHYTFSSDPRVIRDVVGAFELAWERATPHAAYLPGEGN
ncbi:hypothetical protein OIE66_32280 [Nonomuraea sp. NBC_01738]|uniref:DUF6879 family protein n=1 Tax=Nonomuraea sp. NBC_01738 TaxID=2976003 RepID=UPI002E113D31|nr:DUF6879 family protein [Nonomuraea sp. NBC_01738]WSG13264.1 hypothetical protein OIE66_32280 [Nonomuraea sp. NBC_01738]